MDESEQNQLSYDSANGLFHDRPGRLQELKELLLQKDHGLRDLMLERDRRYEDRFKAQEVAVTAALAASKEMTSSAFQSSEKAIVKAEEAQRAYNTAHNDLVRKMDEQYKHMMPRSESEKSFELLGGRMSEFKEALHQVRLELMREITGLRESRSELSGRSLGLGAGWAYLLGAMVLISTVISVVSYMRP